MKLIDLSDYNHASRRYWYAMVAAGTLISAWAAYRCLSFTATQWAEFMALQACAIIASWRPIRIPNTKASVTAGDTFTFLSILFLGVPAAVLIATVDSFVSSRRTSKRSSSWIIAPSMMALTVLIAGQAFFITLTAYGRATGITVIAYPLTFSQIVVPLAVTAMILYFLNSITIATLFALKSRRPLWRFWRNSYLWTSWAFFAAAIGAGVIYGAITHFGIQYVLLSAPFVAVTFWTYKIYFERVNSKTREASEASRLHLATVEALATAIDAKDQTTHCHVRRVQIYAAGMGQVLGLSDSEIAALKAGALLHDIGKLAVPDHILNKPGGLTPAEFEKMKVHTTVGAQILSRVDFPYPVVPIVRHHHEQWNGLGYPDGLKGEQIPVTARIMSVVDCFDSVREDRPFRRGMSREEAISLLRRGSRTIFDPKIVELFVENLPRFEAEIASRGLEQLALAHNPHVSFDPILFAGSHGGGIEDTASFMAYDQIRNAHREVYALYEIASTFGSSLDIQDTLAILVDKVAHIVPFDTCAVYVYDDVKGYATSAHAVGKNAEALRARCIAPGEGVTGFALANRRAINQIHPSLDFIGVELEPDTQYRSMVALPLFKDELLLGALSVYSTELSEYTDDHMRLLETVTRLASDALANALHHAQAESNALTDPLTGLPNARCIQVHFDAEISRSRRTGQPFQVVMLDLDHFKQVNDTFGHRVGDKMLREVANIIHAQLREYDFLARYAGDEFVAILQDLGGPQVVELSERIEAAVSKFSLHVRGERRAQVGISLGAATYGQDGETLDQLLIAADQAMYSAKSAHRVSEAVTAAARKDSPIDLSTGNLATTAIN
jgi:diguanylate cyclase (GGDEF)-like protein/putative nucleotidyltransferase with HDIG domain